MGLTSWHKKKKPETAKYLNKPISNIRKMAQIKEGKAEIKQMVRLMDADVSGEKPVKMALLKVKGVGVSLAGAICSLLKIEPNAKIGLLTESEIKAVEDAIKNPTKIGVPSWMLNRRKDYETGKDSHLITSDLKLSVENDIKRMKKIRCYRGMRHAMGQPVRGQRTKSHFRKGISLGVQRKKEAPAAKPAEKEKK